ncbi:MAG: hypothetical protein GY732_10420 [Gammaproteobacteria bacterium]|nr:hypothetical protein [Gammaproteobacteria bacterium]
MKSKPKTSQDKKIIKTFEAGGVVDYLEYLQSGKRVFWVNFKAGIAKGLGVTVGMTMVLGILVWILTMLINLPVVGEYFAEVKEHVTEYADSTNYQDEFAEQIRLLEEIDKNIKAAENTKVEGNTEP